MTKKRGLGKGLSALIPTEENTPNNNEMRYVDIKNIFPNPDQPRKNIDENNLEELINSIKTHGLIQPIIVRKKDDGNYEIIAGERRWQACKKIKMDKVPVIIKNYTDLEASAAALIENIQREDLNAIDEANAYKRLMEDHGLTQEELSMRLGKSRPFIANMVRILALPNELKDMLTEGIITTGHARALIPLQDNESQIRFALKIIKQHLSVRKTEEMVKKYIEAEGKDKKNKIKDKEILDWEKKLTTRLGKKVTINSNNNGSGKLIIEYKTREELAMVVDNIKIS